ncbi:MAG: cbb3-type cytochrome c oxidase subunit II [Pirellulaceae bacterium]
MPSFRHLLEQDLNFKAILPHVQATAFLGAPYTDEELNNTEAVASAPSGSGGGRYRQARWPGKQEKQAIALIAYLQRLGVDLFATPEPETQPTEGEAAPEENSPVAENPAGETATTDVSSTEKPDITVAAAP